MGDFDEIIFSHEKQGGRLREERNVNTFPEALDDYDFIDLGNEGQWFTWERGRFAHINN